MAMILNAALKGEVAALPMKLRIEPIRENVHTKISLPDELLRKCRKKLGCEKGTLTTVIKAEIRKYAGMPDKYSFLTESYCKAYETVLCEILYSFDMQGNRRALEYLYRINITDIINAAYSRQNGTDGLQDGEKQTKSNNKENKNHE